MFDLKVNCSPLALAGPWHTRGIRKKEFYAILGTYAGE